jgi:gluconate:H+ symporter, GntP family
MSHEASLLLFALGAIIVLVVLIARFKLHPFLGLMLVSVAIGFNSGMKLPAIAKTFQEGVGNTLGFLGVVVGLGMMLGKMLSESGGAHVIAQTFIRLLGERRLPWAMLAVAFVVGVPVLFSVGLVLLVPIVYAIARETKSPLMRVAIPLVAGLSVSQGFLPPHPGPMLAIEQMGADVGKTILYGALIGIPTAIVAGPIFGSLVGAKLKVDLGHLGERATKEVPSHHPPGFALTLLTILLPVLLMLLSSLADLTLAKESRLREWANFFGSPIIAMLLAVLLSIYSFGYARGFSGKQILKFLEECIGPAAAILLVVGAGGGLSKMLDRGGVGGAIADIVEHAQVSPLLLGWFVAAAIRVAVGSATVAITMASAIMAPVAANTPGINRELLVLAMGAGSLFLSHVNDGGFWFVKESFNLTVPQTFKTWTVLETCIGLVALCLVMLLAQFV